MTRLSVWILADQLLADHPALALATAEAGRNNVRVLLIESAARLRKRPYHRRKLALLLSAMRHYAGELRDQGYTVDYAKVDSFAAGLQQHVTTHQPDRLLTMAASEWNGRQFQQSLPSRLGLPVTILPNTQFLTGQFDPYPDPAPDQRVIMEYFYRAMRRHFSVLMDGEAPVGGQWNYDKQNREPLPDGLVPPAIPSFAPDAITHQVMAEIDTAGIGVGQLAGFDLAVTRAQANAAFGNFIAHRLAQFGPYEDAMSQRHQTLWHSALSPYLNIGLLEPRPLIAAAERAYHDGRAPLNSVEGFIRQILGWREYIYWQYWRQMPALAGQNSWSANRPLPAFFWDGQTSMNCLHHVLDRAIRTGYAHHIERLMLLCNFCLLAGITPQAVNDWFLSFFIDAYEWVMLPNVIGMGLNADGGQTATKPYISSANYIDRMSDYCGDCRYQRRARHGPDACPFNFLYWNFLIRHEATLRANPRLGRNVLGLRHLDGAERTAVTRQAAAFLDELAGDAP